MPVAPRPVQEAPPVVPVTEPTPEPAPASAPETSTPTAGAAGQSGAKPGADAMAPPVGANSAVNDLLGGLLPADAPPNVAPPAPGPGFPVGFLTVKGARILNLSIPAPRGQIVDRNGVPLAQNVVVHYLGLNFPFMDEASEEKRIAYARERLEKANAILGKTWTLTDKEILDHYRDRRWLPLVFANLPLPEDERKKVEAAAFPGLVLLPTYQRIYPQQQLAGHIVGYVGKRAPWPKGEVPDGEAMWPTAHGVQGLEKSFDKQLTGVDGRVQIIFNDRGERVEEKVIRHPVPGMNVVTTLDVEMQQLAEQLTEKHVRRGAFVLMEVQTGDILAMSSYPRYDPNEFVPMISAERFNALNNDPEKPMIGRAFQGVYPPASTFKVFSALGLLHAGTITEDSIYDCPNSFTIGDRIARNWNEENEGGMNVIGALARSCNTWFFAGSMVTEAPYITEMGVEFGFGRKTGIPIEEAAGLMPTDAWWQKQFGAKIGKGDLCNISIGQGSVGATPLQVAQAMTAVANRSALVPARLVLQVQDYMENIRDSYDVVPRELKVPARNIDIVQRGMFEVVNSDRGTGKNASHERIHVSGKTGTGQWNPAKSQNIAWFAGFAPSEYPVYAFAAVYEGEPGEKIGGGSKAAPIIGDFFEAYLTEPRLLALRELSDSIQVREPGSVSPTVDPSLQAIYHGAPSVDPLAELEQAKAAQAKRPPPFFRLFGGGKKQPPGR
ncbi:MAG: penicillin-binding protein 2 [Verrucomicrobia bacterium]|jgi:penicillin-binding protein 2|nr:MAG: penicillin-binding protein 2 [Verrucomicrobiota bacterium]